MHVNICFVLSRQPAPWGSRGAESSNPCGFVACVRARNYLHAALTCKGAGTSWALVHVQWAVAPPHDTHTYFLLEGGEQPAEVERRVQAHTAPFEMHTQAPTPSPADLSSPSGAAGDAGSKHSGRGDPAVHNWAQRVFEKQRGS